MENSYDIRGRQSNIFRLWRFDKNALAHMVSFRILIFEAPLAAIFLLLSIVFPISGIILISRILVLIAWILFTPQLFDAFKALSLVSSKGSAFGKFNEYYMKTQKRDPNTGFYETLPYMGLIVWIFFFVVFVFVWFI
jgi:hypothetical protein